MPGARQEQNVQVHIPPHSPGEHAECSPGCAGRFLDDATTAAVGGRNFMDLDFDTGLCGLSIF